MPYKNGARATTTRDASNTVTDASLAPTSDELADRFAAQVERAMRRRQDRRADREERAARRAIGKANGHAAKLRRGGRR